tara:strand:+ start:7114 stop:7344 length:231 start_codon:yes stop_codon:yes gene_type:complete
MKFLQTVSKYQKSIAFLLAVLVVIIMLIIGKPMETIALAVSSIWLVYEKFSKEEVKKDFKENVGIKHSAFKLKSKK